MATLTQLRSRVDNWLAGYWPAVQARQTAYLASHGHYWQGLATTTIVPNHLTAGFVDSVADRLASKPTDQVETWLNFLAELDGVALPAQLTVDVYEAAEGHGYVATVTAQYNGVTYSRSQNVGPQTQRTLDWHTDG